jgi:hypothetical protein
MVVFLRFFSTVSFRGGDKGPEELQWDGWEDGLIREGMWGCVMIPMQYERMQKFP